MGQARKEGQKKVITWKAADTSKPAVGAEKTDSNDVQWRVRKTHGMCTLSYVRCAACLHRVCLSANLCWSMIVNQHNADLGVIPQPKKRTQVYHEARRKKNDDDEDAEKRDQKNFGKRQAQDDEQGAAKRLKTNEKEKLARRKKVKEQRRAFKDRSNALLAEFPDDVRKACIIPLTCIQCLASNSRIQCALMSCAVSCIHTVYRCLISVSCIQCLAA